MSIVGKEIKRLGLMKAYEFLDKNPEENLPKLIDWLDTYTKPGILKIQREFFRDVITKKDGNWYNLLVSLWDDIDDDVRKTLFENLVINSNALAAVTAQESRKKYNCNVPWAIALNIADSNEKEDALDFDEWDNVIEQAKALGTFMFIFQGGEPLDCQQEIIALCNKHDDCEFMVFTYGAGITEAFADEALRVKNLIVCVKVTGTPDDRKLLRSAAILHRKKLPYATYCTYEESDQDLFAREEFFDSMVGAHVKMTFFFSSLPDGEDRVYQEIMKYRRSKPLSTIHFCKDKQIIGGCVAGGRYFLNIDSVGNVQPCFFVRESDTNLREKTLIEALQAPLMMSYHDQEQPCKAGK